MRTPLYWRDPVLTRLLWFLAGAAFMAAVMLAVVVLA